MKNPIQSAKVPRGMTPLLLLCIAGLCLATTLLRAQTCQDGCFVTNTYQGDDALLNIGAGADNTAFGYLALNATASPAYSNTGIGALALFSNLHGTENVAVGTSALGLNVYGSGSTAVGAAALANYAYAYSGPGPTAVGYEALFSDGGGADGDRNTALGYQALYANGIGNGDEGYNTAVGHQSLFSNVGAFNVGVGVFTLYSSTYGDYNVATGAYALYGSTTGTENVATGSFALVKNTTGAQNTANGDQALSSNTFGNSNLADGASALSKNTSGSGNIALGFSAGVNLTTGSNNIYLGNAGGSGGESNRIRIGTKGVQTNSFIAGIFGVTVGTGVPVIVDSTGRLGTVTSSARFKEAIKPMDKRSEAILALHPVSFRYKKALDPAAEPQFGLIAEEVAKVDRDLVAMDENGQPYSVRYAEVNAMLLNEFLKAHRTIEQQAGAIGDLKGEVAELKTALRAQAAQIQKVSAQVEARTAAPRVASTTD